MARILFLGIDFYHYSEHICEAMERLGHQVDFRPMEDRGLAARSAKKLAPAAYRRRLDAYHDRLVSESAKGAYDTVLFIQVQPAHEISPLSVCFNMKPIIKHLLFLIRILLRLHHCHLLPLLQLIGGLILQSQNRW